MSRKVRRPNLATLIEQAEQAGRPVKRVVFARDGGFTLILANDESPIVSGNPWDSVEAAE